MKTSKAGSQRSDGERGLKSRLSFLSRKRIISQSGQKYSKMKLTNSRGIEIQTAAHEFPNDEMFGHSCFLTDAEERSLLAERI